MGIAFGVWLLAGALLAPGDIYRCKDAAGAVSFQDQPCTRGESAHLARAGDDPADSERALRQWLDEYRGRSAATTPEASPSNVRAPRWHGGAIGEAQLAMCSERFLHCASGDAAAMDACIARLPACEAGGGGACCPRSCVARYQDLREAGHALAPAVRLALLDPAPLPAAHRPNCAERFRFRAQEFVFDARFRRIAPFPPGDRASSSGMDIAMGLCTSS